MTFDEEEMISIKPHECLENHSSNIVVSSKREGRSIHFVYKEKREKITFTKGGLLPLTTRKKDKEILKGSNNLEESKSIEDTQSTTILVGLQETYELFGIVEQEKEENIEENVRKRRLIEKILETNMPKEELDFDFERLIKMDMNEEGADLGYEVENQQNQNDHQIDSKENSLIRIQYLGV